MSEIKLGADAAAVAGAGSIASPKLTHAAPWRVDGTVVRCDVGGFKMVWGSNPYSPPIAYAAALDDAHLIAAAPELLEACKEFVRKCECGEASSRRSYAQMKAAIAKAEGR